jgi:hypothetical protein
MVMKLVQGLPTVDALLGLGISRRARARRRGGAGGQVGVAPWEGAALLVALDLGAVVAGGGAAGEIWDIRPPAAVLRS